MGVTHDDRAERLAGAGRLVTVDELDGHIGSADLRPVRDLAGVDGAQVLDGDVVYGVRLVDDDGDAVVGDGDRGEPELLLLGDKACLLYTSRCV